jgi:D-alanyl-D-alanine carboxypeptidase
MHSRIRKTTSLVLVLALLCVMTVMVASCGSSTPSFPKSTTDELQKTLEAGMAKYKVPGAIAGVWYPGKGTWVSVAGVGDKSTGAAPKSTDKVRIGSITKTFTATTVLKLVDEGKLSLEEKLSKYEPQVPGADGITIRQLLNMTSGLFNYTDDQSFWNQWQAAPSAVWPPEKMVDIAIAHPPVFPPGQKYMYCNTNYVLLGMIIEKVTGGAANVEVAKRTIDKLGLKNTTFPSGTAIPSPYMHGYMPAKGETNLGTAKLSDISVYSPSGFWTAGGMISTLDDLKTWAEALSTGKLLSKAMHEEQVKFATPNTETYGLGIMHGGEALGHSGEVPGYNSSMYYLPNKKGTSIVLINRYPSSIEGAADVINGALIKVVFK